MRASLVLAILLLTGCQTTLDPNYVLQLDAYQAALKLQASVQHARATAEAERYRALGEVASVGSEQTRQLAVLALALTGQGANNQAIVVNNLPQAPETAEDKALKWAAILVPPLTQVAQSALSYHLASNQARYASQTTQTAFQTLGQTAANGFTAVQGTARSGFNAIAISNAANASALSSLGQSGFTNLTQLGQSGFTNLNQLGTAGINGTAQVGVAGINGVTATAGAGFNALRDTARLIPQPNNSNNSGVIGGGTNTNTICNGGNGGATTVGGTAGPGGC